MTEKTHSAGVQENGVRDAVRAALEKNPGAMTMQLARDFKVPEVEIIRALPDDDSVELDLGRWQEMLERLESFGTVHVIVSNGAATIEAVGQFGNFSTWGEFFNVQTKSLDMHIRYRNLAAVFAVEKPSHMTGARTVSLQFYDRQGAAAFKVFFNFGDQPSPERLEKFTALKEEFRKPV